MPPSCALLVSFFDLLHVLPSSSLFSFASSPYCSAFALQLANISSPHLTDRLRTIIDMDKIVVLGAGEVLEFDSPANLLEKDDSVFADLCRKSGEYDELRELAMAKRDALKA